MALVSTLPAPERPAPSLQKNLISAAIFATPVVVLGMAAHLNPANPALNSTASNLAQLILTALTLFLAGKPLFARALHSLGNKTLNMFTLITSAASLAWLYSALAVLIPQRFPPSFQLPNGTLPLYFESAAMIILLVLIGQTLEERAQHKTGKTLRQLLNLSPQNAHLVREGDEDQTIPASQIRCGNILRVKPGEQIPADGIVISGTSQVNEATLTGEPIPQSKTIQSPLFAGTLNLEGSLILRASADANNSRLAQITQLVAKAQYSTTPIQRYTDRIAAIFTPAILIIALLTFILWTLLKPEQGTLHGLIAAINVLIIACPCALGLATPVSIAVAVGKGARLGVLVRNAAALEALASINCIFLDKTGTLTTGTPTLNHLHTTLTRQQVLTRAKALEQNSEHPLAAAIARAQTEDDKEEENNKEREEDKTPDKVIDKVIYDATDFRVHPGMGVSATYRGEALALGNTRLMRELGVDIENLHSLAVARYAEGEEVTFLARNGEAIALFSFADPIKDSAPKAVRAMQSNGQHLVILTGGNRASANALAKTLAIKDVHAELLPEQKAAVIQKYQSKGWRVAMVGDGINDAAALALADVGIAVANASDLTRESAAIALLHPSLESLTATLKLAHDTMRNIRQNLILAFTYNLAAVPIAAGLFYPLFGWLLSPAIAALAMTLSSLSVVLNALRLDQNR